MKLLFLLLFFMSSAFASDEIRLALDMANVKEIPRHFRSMLTDDSHINTKGLEGFRASGSSQFSQKGFYEIYKKLGRPPKFVVVDLRQESHGFINGSAITWYAPRDWGNKGLTNLQASENEQKLLANLAIGSTIIVQKFIEKNKEKEIVKAIPLPYLVQSKENEEEFLKREQIPYFRLYITDHTAPAPEEVDRFLAFVKALPEGTWIHFHCRAGDGRTTTFLALYDILKNGHEVSLDDIIARQYHLGGINLFHACKHNWKTPYAQERKHFMKKFYAYANSDAFKKGVSWTGFLTRGNVIDTEIPH